MITRHCTSCNQPEDKLRDPLVTRPDGLYCGTCATKALIRSLNTCPGCDGSLTGGRFYVQPYDTYVCQDCIDLLGLAEGDESGEPGTPAPNLPVPGSRDLPLYTTPGCICRVGGMGRRADCQIHGIGY